MQAVYTATPPASLLHLGNEHLGVHLDHLPIVVLHQLQLSVLVTTQTAGVEYKGGAAQYDEYLVWDQWTGRAF